MSLAAIAYLVGLAMVLIGALAVVNPGRWRQWMLAFPRDQKSAWVLTAIDLICVTYIVVHAQLGRFEILRSLIYVLAPIAFFLLIKYLDELLAPRALGGLMLLVANPVFNAARWHDSDLRLVMTVWAYVIVVFGIILVLSPYRFRHLLSYWVTNDMRCRLGGALKFVFGLVVLALACWVY